MMFKKVLIANRGVISRRIIRTLRKLNIQSVAVYSEADVSSLHVREADEAFLLGPAKVSESYLKADRIIEAALKTGAEAIHPGYGFLSENADFAAACEAAGIAFIGPTSDQMKVFGLKHSARELAEKNNVPLLPGSGLLSSAEEAVTVSSTIGFPVMLKSTAGGGGIGMRVCRNAKEVEEAFVSVQQLSQSNFKDSGIFVEKFIENARHIEVQIFGDGLGKVISLGERDCSTQRRNQKVIEETPAPGLTEEQRKKLSEAAVRLAETVNYRSAGTVEFVYDATTGDFYFLEVNTRLQVEHGVTEEVTRVDLVEWMILLAAGDRSFIDRYQHLPLGHSVQVRVYAEDPHKNFQPSCGLLTEVAFHQDARCETWVEQGTEVTPFYDPMLAKIIVHGSDRKTAIDKLTSALNRTAFEGIETNLEYLRKVILTQEFMAGKIVTRFLSGFVYEPLTVDVIDGGAQTTIQDYPGRVGFWDVGVSPSGPMDHYAHRMANRLVSNPETVATLEVVMAGPTMVFNTSSEVAITGANFEPTLNNTPVPQWTSIMVKPGDRLKLGSVKGVGARGYIAVRGGWQVPRYLGSRSTFTMGRFGGHGGRTIRAGDVLHLLSMENPEASGLVAEPSLIPAYTKNWEIGVLYGPHGAPDFFTEESITNFFETDWKVHYNSNRTGLRLVGPKPTWARTDGGEAGLHPSNVHDNPYAIGAINFTGDMPIILGPDGPSLGGFVCPACIVQSELWKIGQIRPGDMIRFRRMTLAEANDSEKRQDLEIESLRFIERPAAPLKPEILESAIEHQISEDEGRIGVTYRRSGDKYLLIEYGPLVLDLEFRFRIHALMEWLKAHHLPGLIDLTPGVRTLQIHYDCRLLPLRELMQALLQAEEELPDSDQIEISSRIVHMPLSWDDAVVTEAIQKYMQSVRADAPWNPSNIEFMRRLNGLESVDQVCSTVFDTSYLVMGLGDVYLGAPAAAPMDPRHRLLTTKYNPARTWTAEGTVGIGGVYMCIYGMDSPGGYQLIGRTVQVWNSWKTTPDFEPGKPWLLRFFDQVRFYPVSPQELEGYRASFLQGDFKLRIENEVLRLKDYRAFLAKNQDSIDQFRSQQQKAFIEERERWAQAGSSVIETVQEMEKAPVVADYPEGAHVLSSPMPGSIWKVLVKEGDRVEMEDKLLVLESMKLEAPIHAPVSGLVHSIPCSAGKVVEAGQVLMVIIEDKK